MTIPAPATKTNLDQTTDNPKLARAELADNVDKFNQLRQHIIDAPFANNQYQVGDGLEVATGQVRGKIIPGWGIGRHSGGFYFDIAGNLSDIPELVDWSADRVPIHNASSGGVNRVSPYDIVKLYAYYAGQIGGIDVNSDRIPIWDLDGGVLRWFVPSQLTLSPWKKLGDAYPSGVVESAMDGLPGAVRNVVVMGWARANGSNVNISFQWRKAGPTNIGSYYALPSAEIVSALRLGTNMANGTDVFFVLELPGASGALNKVTFGRSVQVTPLGAVESGGLVADTAAITGARIFSSTGTLTGWWHIFYSE
ncbi:hypothetical protein FHP25_35845 [Vineibacter terrae]|uniref:Uncharacterized protein n=1 Tax=Vineibacter terrae TaxID=2586908 RepID=A0A5C8P8M9_9HYPH|nr:hypothetical protein [Vineibacter terrae]TXL70097.1 hypothetical protein FHP25_35845 [Vineibacter terrae]